MNLSGTRRQLDQSFLSGTQQLANHSEVDGFTDKSAIGRLQHMVTYTLEPTASCFFEQWVIIAHLGNQLKWEVGCYLDKRRADERLARIKEMVRADALPL
jgi:hypothetical protein